MNAVSALQTYVVPKSFKKAIRSIRAALNEMGLEIVGEFEMSEDSAGELGRSKLFRILLVSCPILDFEAIALGRASAVFFPLHVLVCAKDDETRVSIVNASMVFEARLPVGASDPLDKLVARTAMAMDSVLRRREK